MQDIEISDAEDSHLMSDSSSSSNKEAYEHLQTDMLDHGAVHIADATLDT